MPDEKLNVVAQADTFLRIARARPLSAVAELIWNSLDADATNISVHFDEGALGLNGIVVEDNGLGATPAEAKEYFRKLGGSWKKVGARTKRHDRVLHGSQGQGRYKALSLGRDVSWRFFYDQDGVVFEFKLEILSNLPSEVLASVPVTSSRNHTGCVVHIREPNHQFRNLSGEPMAQELAELFAIYLADYPDITIQYGSHRLDPEQAISTRFSLSLPDVTGADDRQYEGGVLRVLEWKHLDRRSLFVCDARGFALQQVPTKFHLRRQSFSAYLSSPYLDRLEVEGRLTLSDLDVTATNIIESAKEAIKDHYDLEEKKASAKIIEEWKSLEIYPYRSKPANSVEEAERQVFDIVALRIQAAHVELSTASRVSKALHLELLRHAIETGPNQLREILAKVVVLPKREQDDLAKLLEETTLSSIIGASKVVSDRLNFLRSLHQIVYDYTADGRIRERTQLHRILAANPWIFGEEFIVSTDDRSLTAVLKAHRALLDENIVIDEPVKHVSQTRGIVDLMLSRLLSRYRADEVEHLVVELKRPGVLVGQAEINQIMGYAASIEADSRFATRNGVVWRFWVISDGLDTMGKYAVQSDQTGRGLIRDTPTAKIYVKTWDQLIAENQSRYQFIQEKLNFSASDEGSMRFLREEHAALLEGVVVESDLGEKVA